jgi:hypothetical protein
LDFICRSENRIKKTAKNCLKEGIKKNNRGGEFDQNTLDIYMGIAQ